MSVFNGVVHFSPDLLLHFHWIIQRINNYYITNKKRELPAPLFYAIRFSSAKDR